LAIAKTFESNDFVPGDPKREQETRTDGPAVKQDGASSAGAHAAAFPHAPEFESVPKDLKQGLGVLHRDFHFPAVEPERYLSKHRR
jgi:hypothetical protein